MEIRCFWGTWLRNQNSVSKMTSVHCYLGNVWSQTCELDGIQIQDSRWWIQDGGRVLLFWLLQTPNFSVFYSLITNYLFKILNFKGKDLRLISIIWKKIVFMKCSLKFKNKNYGWIESGILVLHLWTHSFHFKI